MGARTEYMRKYHSRPEVRERIRKYRKDRWANDPSYKKQRKQLRKNWLASIGHTEASYKAMARARDKRRASAR